MSSKASNVKIVEGMCERITRVREIRRRAINTGVPPVADETRELIDLACLLADDLLFVLPMVTFPRNGKPT